MTEEQIRALAKKIDIDLIGFFSVEPLMECLPYLCKRENKGFSTGFEGAPAVERINFYKQFPLAKTGIVIGINNFQTFKKLDDDQERGHIASVSWGEDYHKVLKRRMNELMTAVNLELEKNGEACSEYKIFVDNSPLVDRGSAYRAGLGFFGKNNCLINAQFGSYFFIGQILWGYEVSISDVAPVENGCHDCRRCLDACPGQALGDGYELNPSKCISFLTQKKNLSPLEEGYVKKYLYGCDICQQVCPYNQNLQKTNEKSFWIEAEVASPKLIDVLELTNNSYKKAYHETASGWRGKKVFLRNAELVLKNKKKKMIN